MVTRSNDCPRRDVCVCDGVGLTHIKELTDPAGLHHHGTLFAHVVVDPGCSIGEHPHHGETEFYYMLKGEAVFSDNGVETVVHAGDVCATGGGEHHSLENRTGEPVELMSLIVTEK